MLKFRFKRKEMRRRSNSCPNLDSCHSPFESGVQRRDHMTNKAKHMSYFMDNNAEKESETEEEVPYPSRKERLQAQKSIKKMKKKEKEQQENAEKNLLSVDDFWRKLDSLKEWLHEQEQEEIDKMHSPKLRSHFKKFVRLWNKRKLPLKYYRHCCVDGEEGSSGANNSTPQTPCNDQNEFFPHKTLRDLPSYHRFPFIDEPLDEMTPVFTSPVSLRTDLDTTGAKEFGWSPFSTFGKDSNNPQTSTSLLARQVELRQSQRGCTKSKVKAGHSSPTSSPQKFATISRTTPSSCIFKVHNSVTSPQLHPVLSPTCPNPPQFVFPSKASGSTSSPLAPDNAADAKRPSPAYMAVQDAIPFASNSPKYSQLEFDDSVFEPQSDYCSLSPLSGRNSCRQAKCPQFVKPSLHLNRRRSKSMEDIYAVPSRLVNFGIGTSGSPLEEEFVLKTPPIPVKKFTPTPSMADLGVSRGLPSVGKWDSNDTLASITVNRPESRLVSVSSDCPSLNSLSTDLGYQSCKYDESLGSDGNKVFVDSSLQLQYDATKFSYHIRSRQERMAFKRRSEEHEITVADSESVKKMRPESPLPNEKVDQSVNDVGEISHLEPKDTMDMVLPDYLKDGSSNDSETKPAQNQCLIKPNPMFSILTGSLKPTTRSPQCDGVKQTRAKSKSKSSRKSSSVKTKNKKGEEKDGSRLSILEIKVLDSSPTFPRRRVKRRSSNLVVTPGKNLTFGNKNSRQVVVSSPRRVSFAKNAKSGDETASSRRRSSLSTASPATAVDISRQCQDRATFESFWAKHSSPSKSPTNKVSSKLWSSPSKWLSPTKAVSSPTKQTGLDSQTKSSSTKDSDYDIAKDPDGNKVSLVKSLSPKKLFTSFQKNSSSSLFSTSSSSSSPAANYGANSTKEPKQTVLMGAKPKSILKPKSSIPPHAHATHSTSVMSLTKDALNSQNAETLSLSQDWFAKRISNESDVSLCRSPPRLGVASLLKPNSPVQSRAISLEGRLKVTTKPASKNNQREVNSINTNTSFKIPHSSGSHSQVPSDDNNLKSFDCPGRRVKETEFGPPGKCKRLELFARSLSSESSCDESVDGIEQRTGSRDGSLIQTNGSIARGFNVVKAVEVDSVVAGVSGSLAHSSCASEKNTTHGTQSGSCVELAENDQGQCDLELESQKAGDCTGWTTNGERFDLSGMEVSAHSSHIVSEAVMDVGEGSEYDVGSFSRTPTCGWNEKQDTVDGKERDLQPMPFTSSRNYSPFEEVYSLGQTLDLDKSGSSLITEPRSPLVRGEQEEDISKNVLERIRSFRASPKVEDNDGWITERRRSKGSSKTKSFRSAHNRYLLRSGPHDDQGSGSPASGMDLSWSEVNVESGEFGVGGDMESSIHDGNPGIISVTPVHSSCETAPMSLSRTQNREENMSDLLCLDTKKINDDYVETNQIDKVYESGKQSTVVKIGSLTSVASTDSGTGKLVESCPVYDVPKTGIRPALPVTGQEFPSPGDDVDNASAIQAHVSASPHNGNITDALTAFDNPTLPKTLEKAETNVPEQKSSGTLSAIGLDEIQEADHDSNKENQRESPVVSFKPRPVVKPKPSPKPGHLLLSSPSFRSNSPHTQTTSPSSPRPPVKRRSSVYKKDMSSGTVRQPSVAPSNTFKSSTSSPKSATKRRSSVYKKDSPSAGVFRPAPTSNSFRSINADSPTRPLVRKRSSVAKRDDLNRMALKNSSSAISTIGETDKNGKRESLTPKKRRSSLEKGRRISGSAGPEKDSFTQRRKFFQQLQQIPGVATVTRTASQLGARSHLKATESFLSKMKMRPQTAPKPRPAVKPKPRVQADTEV